MQFDPATEGPGRQAGSSFKVFTLAAALSRGYSPERHGVDGAAALAPRPGLGRGLVLQHRRRSDDCGGDTISLTQAIARSDNCAFVRTELSLGPGQLRRRRRARPSSRWPRRWASTRRTSSRVVSTTLGTNGVHPLEMAQAYSVLAERRRAKRATFVTKIVDRNGKMIYQAPTAGTRVLDPNVARTETQMLTGVLRSGTAAARSAASPGPRRARPGRPTTTRTPGSSATRRSSPPRCGWATRDGEIPMTNVGGITVFGATYPGADLAAVHEGRDRDRCPSLDFTAPDEHAVPPVALHHRARPHGTTYVAVRLPRPARPSPCTTPPTPATAPPRRRRRTTTPHDRSRRRKPTRRNAAQRRTGRGRDVSLDELEALLLVQEQRHHARPAAPPAGGDARTRRARRRAPPSCARTEGERGRGRRTPPRRARRGAPHRRRGAGGRRARRRGEQAPLLGHDLVAARAAGDAGRHRHAAPAPLRPRRRRARGDGAARDARRASSRARRARSPRCRRDVARAARRRSRRPRRRSTPRSRARPRRAPISPSRSRSRCSRDYERRRAQNRGAGAARLVGTTCQACHLTIPSTEAEQIRRAAGSVVAYCDNCAAILVP